MTGARLCMATLLVAALAGCHSGTKSYQAAGTNMASTTGAQETNVAPAQVDELNEPNGPLAKRSIHFDFDAYTVKSAYQPLLQAHAQYLRSHPNRHVMIQGNTDERGTTEYNLALGERRSEAVLHDLETLGVPDSQIEAVSFGKEKPQALGHDEASWEHNRRADLVYR